MNTSMTSVFGDTAIFVQTITLSDGSQAGIWLRPDDGMFRSILPGSDRIISSETMNGVINALNDAIKVRDRDSGLEFWVRFSSNSCCGDLGDHLYAVEARDASQGIFDGVWNADLRGDLAEPFVPTYSVKEKPSSARAPTRGRWIPFDEARPLVMLLRKHRGVLTAVRPVNGREAALKAMGHALWGREASKLSHQQWIAMACKESAIYYTLALEDIQRVLNAFNHLKDELEAPEPLHTDT